MDVPTNHDVIFVLREEINALNDKLQAANEAKEAAETQAAENLRCSRENLAFADQALADKAAAEARNVALAEAVRLLQEWGEEPAEYDDAGNLVISPEDHALLKRAIKLADVALTTTPTALVEQARRQAEDTRRIDDLERMGAREIYFADHTFISFGGMTLRDAIQPALDHFRAAEEQSRGEAFKGGE